MEFQHGLGWKGACGSFLFSCPRLFQAQSNPDFNISRDRTATAFLGRLCQGLPHRNREELIPNISSTTGSGKPFPVSHPFIPYSKTTPCLHQRLNPIPKKPLDGADQNPPLCGGVIPIFEGQVHIFSREIKLREPSPSCSIHRIVPSGSPTAARLQMPPLEKRDAPLLLPARRKGSIPIPHPSTAGHSQGCSRDFCTTSPISKFVSGTRSQFSAVCSLLWSGPRINLGTGNKTPAIPHGSKESH